MSQDRVNYVVVVCRSAVGYVICANRIAGNSYAISRKSSNSRKMAVMAYYAVDPIVQWAL